MNEKKTLKYVCRECGSRMLFRDKVIRILYIHPATGEELEGKRMERRVKRDVVCQAHIGHRAGWRYDDASGYVMPENPWTVEEVLRREA